MKDLLIAQAEARALLNPMETYSVQSVNQFSGKWVTERTTGHYSHARYERTRLRKLKGRNKARIIYTVSGEVID